MIENPIKRVTLGSSGFIIYLYWFLMKILFQFIFIFHSFERRVFGVLKFPPVWRLGFFPPFFFLSAILTKEFQAWFFYFHFFDGEISCSDEMFLFTFNSLTTTNRIAASSCPTSAIVLRSNKFCLVIKTNFLWLFSLVIFSKLFIFIIEIYCVILILLFRHVFRSFFFKKTRDLLESDYNTQNIFVFLTFFFFSQLLTAWGASSLHVRTFESFLLEWKLFFTIFSLKNKIFPPTCSLRFFFLEISYKKCFFSLWDFVRLYFSCNITLLLSLTRRRGKIRVSAKYEARLMLFSYQEVLIWKNDKNIL